MCRTPMSSAIGCIATTATAPSRMSRTMQEPRCGRRTGRRVVACDVNNDGYQDLYVGAQGSITDRLDYRSQPDGDQNIDRLLLNRGNGTFTDITEAAFGDAVNRRTAMSATCADVDRDGWLDIYVGNLAEDEFRGMSVPFQNGQYNVLYRNNGNLTFSDISETSGVQGPQVWMRERDGDTGEVQGRADRGRV